MPEHPNAAVARQAVEALDREDWEAAMALLDDDVEWHELGSTEPRRGKQALAEAYAPREGGVAGADFRITVEPHDFLANDDHAVALVTAHATRGGKSLTYRTAEIYHVKDGKITARWAFSDDTKAINDFFA